LHWKCFWLVCAARSAR